MRKRRILSLLLAFTVIATMITAVPLTANAADGDITWNAKTVYASELAGKTNETGPAEISSWTDTTGVLTVAPFNETAGNNVGHWGLSGNGILGASNPKYYNGETYANPIDKAENLNKTGHPANRGCGLKLTVTKNGKITITGKIGKTKDFQVVETDRDADTGTLIKHMNNPTSNVDGSLFEDVPVKSDKDYYIYGTGTKVTYYTITFTPASEVPTLNITPDTLSLAPGESGKITAEKLNIEESITWSSNNDKVTISDDSDTGATVTVDADASELIGQTAKITAKAGSLQKECTVNIVSPSKDVVIKGCAGLKEITLTDKSGSGKKYVAEWKRDGTHEVSLNDNKGGDNYKQEVPNDNGGTKAVREYMRTINDVPYGNYTVTAEFDETYYTSGSCPTELTVGGDLAIPAITAKATAITDNCAEETIDYSLLSNEITFDFTTKDCSPNEYIALQGKGETKVYSSSPEPNPNLYIKVDTVKHNQESKNTPKFNSIDRAGNVQVNAETIMYIPVRNGSVVKFLSDSTRNSFKVKINDGAEAVNTYTHIGGDGFIKAEATGDYGYIDKITVETPVQWEKPDTDSGYYTDVDGYTKGVIRFLQGFTTENTLTYYGFYIVDKNGVIIKNEQKEVSTGDHAVDPDTAGIYADLVGIPRNNNDFYYMMAYAKTADSTYLGPVFGRQVDWNTEVKNPE